MLQIRVRMDLGVMVMKRCHRYTQASLLNSDGLVVQSSGHTLVSRACLGHGSGRVLAYWLEIFFDLRGPHPGFYPLTGDWVYCLAPEVTLIRGMPRYFCPCRTRVGFGPATRPTLKTVFCQICTFVGRMINTHCDEKVLHISLNSTLDEF